MEQQEPDFVFPRPSLQKHKHAKTIASNCTHLREFKDNNPCVGLRGHTFAQTLHCIIDFPLPKRFTPADGYRDVRDNADMFRTRFKHQIVAGFVPPSRPRKAQKLIILCDGMPSIPRKQPLSEFLAAKGFWVIYPRYRGTWESDGRFLEKSPHEDILDIIDDLPRGMEEIAFGRRFRLSPDQTFVIGGSFGGAAAILLSLDPRVKRVIANCPVVDWGTLDRSEKMETINENYAEYIREAFGNGYRLADADWNK